MFINTNFKNNQNTFSEHEAHLMLQQHQTVKEFFQRDSSVEIVNSLNTLVETFLFSEDSDNVTHEMRVHIANQLRVVTLITTLGESSLYRKKDD